MVYRISDVYNAYRRGQTPKQGLSYNRDNEVEYATCEIASRGTLFARKTKQGNYLIARIEPVKESQTEKLTRQARNPSPNNNVDNKFKWCRFQMLTVNIPEYSSGGQRRSVRTLEEKCNNKWNTPEATKLRTANSARSLKSQFEERYYQELK
jgi:hypothetical protein